MSLADLNNSNQDKGDNLSRKGTLSRLKKAVSLGSLSGSGGEKKPKKVWVENEEIAKFKVQNHKMHAGFISTTLYFRSGKSGA